MSDPKRIVIVGGVAGGASAAARARRLSEEVEIILFERDEYISFANCGLPYHISGAIKDRDRLLVQTPQAMRQRFNIDVRTQTEVMKINRERKEVIVRNVLTGDESSQPYDALILSPGAAPVLPPMDGIDNDRIFTLRSMADMDAIKKVVDNAAAKKAIVIGAGFIGLEMAEALAARGLEVTIVEAQPQAFAPVDPEMAAPIHHQLKLHGIDLRLSTKVESFSENQSGIQVSLDTGQAISGDLVIMSIGVRPETDLAVNAGLKIGKRGGISVDQHMRTNDPNVYAVGDAVEVRDFVGDHDTLLPLAGPANRQGRIAAENALGGNAVYRNTQGTSICKIFDLTAGVTGMNEKAIKRSGRRYEKVYIHPADHASYYPGSIQLNVKLLFDPKDGSILGAQVIGPKGVDKRIDVFAVAIRAGLTVYDLQDLELSYAPPYGSAKDPVNYAGFVAANILKGDMPICHTDDVTAITSDQMLIDVRTLEEVQTGTITGAVNIPLDELRGRLDELDRDKELLVFCRVGLRAYLATRILLQNGFKCRNLSGGIITYNAVTCDLHASDPACKSETESDPACKSKPESEPSYNRTDGDNMIEIQKEIDASGLQCPGPVMRLKKGIEEISTGQSLAITSTDPGFASDIPAWCESTGNQFVEMTPNAGSYRAVITKGQPKSCDDTPSQKGNGKTLVVFSNDFDKAMASFIIANGAASMGSEVTMFFTFWGLNLLRKSTAVKVEKNLIEKMFGFMMPRGAAKTKLSKMNMAGMGTMMMKGIMRKKNVSSLPELIASARDNGVRLVACAMSMDLMGIKHEELIDGVEQGGVAMYLRQAEKGNVNLFI